MDHNPARQWDFLSAALLVLILLTTGLRLYITRWAAGLEVAILLALCGVVLGLALGFSLFKPQSVFWIACEYSVSIILLILGWFFNRGGFWLGSIVDLDNRLAHAFDLFTKNQPVQDTILFVVFMALLFWIISLVAGYCVTRFGNFIAAVVPAGAVLVTVQLYNSGNQGGNALLVIYLILCLLLLGRLTYVRRQRFWEEHHVSIGNESRSYLNIMLVVVALVTVLLVWVAPTSVKSFSQVRSAWEEFTRPLRDIQKDLGHAVAGLKVIRKTSTIQFYNDILPLGQQAAQGEQVYLRIQVPLYHTTRHFYWRVRSYNIFLEDRWYAQDLSSTPFSSDSPLITLADPEGAASTFTFTPLAFNLAELVTPARAVWVNYPSKLAFIQVSTEEMDPIQFLADPPAPAGKPYEVRAVEYEPTVLQLRGAGETYPDWVTSHYLQLPDTLPPEIVALARQITVDAKTPYDRADSITNYLRDNITYVTSVENPPPGQEALEWFLLDSKKGFCNYYATAEVILLRAVGIPARMVVGFAQGEYQSPNQYLIRQRDAHAWPEVYFPGAGWVEFEPTTSQLQLERPAGETVSSAGQTGIPTPLIKETEQATPVPTGGGKTGWELGGAMTLLLGWIVRLILIISVIATFLLLYTLGTFDRILRANRRIFQSPLPVLLKNSLEKRALTPPGWLLRWAYLSELNPIERAFMTVYRSLHWLGEKASPAKTPAEAALSLSGLLPNVSTEIHTLLEEYQNHLYSHRRGLLPFAQRAAKTVRQEAFRAALRLRMRRLRSIFIRSR